jgi:hypothetical protein
MTDIFSDAHLSCLMRAAQEGDAAAYLELLQLVTPYVRRIVAHHRGFAGRENVEDLVQDVLLSLQGSARHTITTARSLPGFSPSSDTALLMALDAMRGRRGMRCRLMTNV